MGKKKTTEQFIKEAKQIHGDKYDYSKVEYINATTKVCIICHKKDENGIEHGEFWQTPAMHLSKQGCSKCGGTHKSSKDEFIKKARKIHDNKYDYSEVDYINNKTRVTILCPIHGKFLQRPDTHLRGCGCNKCGYDEVAEKCKKNIKNFIQQARLIHGDKYDYSKVEYKNNKTKVCIVCPKHGEFWQEPSRHLQGEGCPFCKQSHLETEIRLFLTKEKENFIQEYKTEWLGLQRLDFYLPKYNAAIECQGKQHFELGGWFKRNFLDIKERDERKRKLCEKYGIKLFYYSNLGIKYPYKVFENKEEMLKIIKQ